MLSQGEAVFQRNRCIYMGRGCRADATERSRVSSEPAVLQFAAAMRLLLLFAGLFWFSAAILAQAPADPFQPIATMKQLMVEIIYPASNEILLIVNRGGPSDDAEWAAVQRSAMTLAESGNLLIIRNRSAGWVAHATTMMAVGASAHKAAESKDGKGLAALAEALDRSCLACHKQFRPTVFPAVK